MPVPFPHDKLAAVCSAPVTRALVLGRIQLHWDHIVDAMKDRGLTEVSSLVAAAATIAVECHFAPISENGNAAYFKKAYGNRKDYEVDAAGLWKWRGRGFVQLTGKDNYQKYGRLVGEDLMANPDRALDPMVAAKIFAAYFKTNSCDVWAARGHWLKVREIVNGKPKNKKPNGWTEFIELV